MENLNDEIRSLSAIDPLKEAEKLTGVSYKNDHTTSMLGFAMQLDKSKKMHQLMDETNDTKFGDSVKDYIVKITSFGFEKVLQIPFVGTDSAAKEENLYAFFESSRGILLIFDTYGGDRVNGGNMYYNWCTHADKPRGRITSTGGFMSCKYDGKHKQLVCLDDQFKQVIPELPPQIYDYRLQSQEYNLREKEISNIIYSYWNVWVGSHDCREAVIHNISELERHGPFLSNWQQLEYISFCHYMDWKDDYTTASIDELVKSRLNMLPEWVKIQIGLQK